MKAALQFSILLIFYSQPFDCGFISNIGGRITDNVADAVKHALKVPDTIVDKLGQTLGLNNITSKIEGIPGKIDSAVDNIQKIPEHLQKDMSKTSDDATGKLNATGTPTGEVTEPSNQKTTATAWT